MSLIFTNNGSSGLNGTSLEAYGGDKRVVVVVSREAVQDFGLIRAQEAARAKYARKEIENNGTVRVMTTDCG